MDLNSCLFCVLQTLGIFNNANYFLVFVDEFRKRWNRDETISWKFDESADNEFHPVSLPPNKHWNLTATQKRETQVSEGRPFGAQVGETDYDSARREVFRESPSFNYLSIIPKLVARTSSNANLADCSTAQWLQCRSMIIRMRNRNKSVFMCCQVSDN